MASSVMKPGINIRETRASMLEFPADRNAHVISLCTIWSVSSDHILIKYVSIESLIPPDVRCMSYHQREVTILSRPHGSELHLSPATNEYLEVAPNL